MTMTTEETLRLTIAALMQATGESKTHLAAGIGLTQPKVSRRQNGQTAWTLADCDALATHYGITVLQLLAGPAEACKALPPDRRRAATTRRTPVSSAAPARPTQQPDETRPAAAAAQSVTPSDPDGHSGERTSVSSAAVEEQDGGDKQRRQIQAVYSPDGSSEAFDRITQIVESVIDEYRGDVEEARAQLEYRAVRDAMDLLDVCRKNGRFEFSVFPPMPEILKKKTARAPDQIWEARMNWKFGQLPSGQSEVEVLDVNGSYLAAMKSHLPIGALQHRNGSEPDPERARRQAGVHLVSPPAWEHEDLPNPIGKRDEPGQLWITESTLRLLQRLSTEKYGRLCEAPIIHESWYSAGSENLLDKFRRVLSSKRQQAIEEGDDLTEKYVKAIYSKFVSTMGESSSNFAMRRPDWMHIIRSQAAANLWLKAYKARQTGLTVVEVSGTDELHVIGNWRKVFKEGRSLSEIKSVKTYTISGEGSTI